MDAVPSGVGSSRAPGSRTAMAESSKSRKLRFEVAFVSGEDPEYPASELNVHSPHTRGWATPR